MSPHEELVERLLSRAVDFEPGDLRLLVHGLLSEIAAAGLAVVPGRVTLEIAEALSPHLDNSSHTQWAWEVALAAAPDYTGTRCSAK